MFSGTTRICVTTRLYNTLSPSRCLSVHVRTAHLKMGNPVPLRSALLSSNLTAYMCVCMRVCFVGLRLFAYIDLCILDCVYVLCMCVCAALTLNCTTGTPEPFSPPSPHLLNNLTPCRHYSDDKGRMFAPRDAMETASRPHLTEAAEHAHTKGEEENFRHTNCIDAWTHLKL